MSELDRFAEELRRVFARRPVEGTSWREPLAMPAALGRVRQSFGNRLAERVGARTNRALMGFRLAPQQTGPVELKLICRALARPADWEQRRLIDDDTLFARLLAQVDALRQHPARYRACLRALQQSLQELQREKRPLRGNEMLLQFWLTRSGPPPRTAR